MGHLSVLLDLAIVFGIAVLVVRVCKRAGIPVVIAYLLTGVLLSKKALGQYTDVDMAQADAFAEVGVILLLFTVGLEFSVKNLWRIRKLVLIGGSLQLLFTIGFATLFGRVLGFSWAQSVNYGCLLSLSSTAIVIKILQERYQMASEHGKVLLGVLLFQDVATVPILLALPMLAGQNEAPIGAEVLLLLAKMTGLGLASWLAARYVLPRLLFQVMQIKSQEVFLLATISLVGFITTLTSWMGLSLALGAFVAGLIISETDYNRLAISCMLPFRYVFLSFFFIAMGMLVDLTQLWQEPLRVAGTVAYIIVLKTAAATLAVWLLKVPIKTAIMVGLGMAQVGEFSFVMAGVGLKLGLLEAFYYQQFLISAIITMGLTPVLLSRGEQIADWLLRRNNRPPAAADDLKTEALAALPDQAL